MGISGAIMCRKTRISAPLLNSFICIVDCVSYTRLLLLISDKGVFQTVALSIA